MRLLSSLNTSQNCVTPIGMFFFCSFFFIFAFWRLCKHLELVFTIRHIQQSHTHAAQKVSNDFQQLSQSQHSQCEFLFCYKVFFSCCWCFCNSLNFKVDRILRLHFSLWSMSKTNGVRDIIYIYRTLKSRFFNSLIQHRK